jgi:hypothetical protein
VTIQTLFLGNVDPLGKYLGSAGYDRGGTMCEISEALRYKSGADIYLGIIQGLEGALRILMRTWSVPMLLNSCSNTVNSRVGNLNYFYDTLWLTRLN